MRLVERSGVVRLRKKAGVASVAPPREPPVALFPVHEGQPEALKTVVSLARSLVTEVLPEKNEEVPEHAMERLEGLAAKTAPPFPPTTVFPVNTVEASMTRLAWEGQEEETMALHWWDMYSPAPKVAVLLRKVEPEMVVLLETTTAMAPPAPALLRRSAW